MGDPTLTEMLELLELAHVGNESAAGRLRGDLRALFERVGELEKDFAKALRMIPLGKISQEDIEWARAILAEPADA